MNHDVFISYAEKDETIATRLVASLEKKGVSCWFAPRDNESGLRFAGGIVKAIDQSVLFILVLSRSSDRSRYVRNEVARGFENDIPILEFRIEDFTPSPEITFYLNPFHRFPVKDLTPETLDKFVGVVLEKLRLRRIRVIGTRLPAKPLFGRDEDMRKILSMLGKNSLAVIGIQGVGKSKFVSAVFEELVDHLQSAFKTFVWMQFRMDAPPTFASFGRNVIQELTGNPLGFDQLSDSDRIAAILQLLREKRVLVVVDQFESAIDPETRTPKEPVFARFLSALIHQDVGSARVLLTSWYVPKDDQGLAFPHYFLSGLDSLSGLQLFNTIVGNPSGRDRERFLQNAVDRLGGHPWAIELIARNYSGAEIRQIMEEEYLWGQEILEIADRIVSPVYNRLAPESQAALVAACIFFKPAPREGIAFTAGVENIFSALRDLRQRGLVIEAADEFYDIHTLVREFVNRQTAREVRQQLHLRAAEFYQKCPCPPREIRTSINDVMSLLNAIEHFLAANEAESATALLLDNGLYEDLYWWGHYLLLATLYQQLLKHNISPKRRIVLHIQLGKVLRNLGIFEEAKRTYENALPFVGEAADRESEIGLYISLGDILYYLNDLDRAFEYHHLAEILLASNPNPILQSENAGDMANVLLSKKKYEEARQLYERAIVFSQDSSSRIYEGIWNGGLANLYSELFSNSGETTHRDRAVSHYLQAIEISKETKDLRHESHWKGVLGNFYRLLGEDELSETYLREALFISKKIGYRGLRSQMQWLAVLFTKCIQKHMEGLDFKAALDVGRRFHHTACEIGIAELEFEAERQFKELKPLNGITDHFPKNQVEQGDSKTCRDLGTVCMRWGRRTGMKKYFQLAIDAYTNAMAKSIDDSIAPLFEERATAYALLGRIEEAIADYSEALRRNPQNSAAALSRAEVQIWAGRYDESKRALEAMHLWLKSTPERVLRAWLMCHCLNLMGLDFSVYQKFLEDMAKEKVELTYGVKDIEHYLQQLDKTKFSETQIQNTWMIQNLIVRFTGLPNS